MTVEKAGEQASGFPQERAGKLVESLRNVKIDVKIDFGRVNMTENTITLV